MSDSKTKSIEVSLYPAQINELQAIGKQVNACVSEIVQEAVNMHIARYRQILSVLKNN